MRLFRSVVVLFAIFVLIGCGGGGGGGETPANSDTNITNTNSSNGDGKKTYSIDENSNNAIMGPLKDATVNVYRLTDLDKVVETTKTGELGAFSLKLENIPDDELLLVAISGGSDLDANDDGILDDNPTENKGTIHGFATAKELKDGKVNITLLSEIVYQYSKHLIGEVHPDDLKQAINIVSSKFLKDDTTRALKTYQDINSFLPIKGDSVKKLDFNYSDLIGENSLADAIHKDDNSTSIKTELKTLFGDKISLNSVNLIQDTIYKKIVLTKPIHSTITSTGTSIFVNDNNKSSLIDFVHKDSNVTFTITTDSEVKVTGWNGCDKVSNDFKTCYIEKINNDKIISANVSYIETIYADNVKDISDLYVTTNDNNYTISLDLDTNQIIKDFVDSIGVDDIILSNTLGFFRKVISINKVDEYNYIFETSDASILEVYKQGSFSINRNLTHDDLIENLDTINRSLSKDHMILLPPTKDNDELFVIKINPEISSSNSLNRNLELSNTSGGWVELKPGIKVKGDIKFKIGIDFDSDIGLFSYENLKFITTQSVESSLSVELSQSLAGEGEQEYYSRNGVECKRNIDGTYGCQTELLKIPSNFKVMAGPVAITVPPIAFGIGAEGKLEAAATISGKVKVDQRIGFQVVGSVFDYHNYDGIYDLDFAGSADADIEAKLSLGAFVYLEPKFLIYGMAGFEIEPKVGLYLTEAIKAELLNGVEATQVYAKWDLKASAKLNWAWNDYISDFDWAESFQNKLNQILREKEVGVETSFTLKEDKWYLYQQKPAFLSIEEGGNIQENIFRNENFSKTYSYKIKNTGDEDLLVNIVKDDDLMLSDYLTIYPTELTLAKGEEGYVSINMEIPANSLSNNMYQGIVNFINKSSSGTNIETGTKQININLNTKLKLEAPTNLTVDFKGVGALKRLFFAWDNLNQDIDSIRLYKSDFNANTQSCNSNYLFFTRSANTSATELYYKDFENQLEAGKKYCFKVTLEKDSTVSDSSNEVQLEIPAYGSLQSSIIDIETKEPIENAKVYLTLLANNTRTDASGDYKFENLLPGEYKIVVEAEGYIRKEGQVTIKPNELERYQTELMMDKGLEGIVGTVEGKVKDAINGSGVSGVTIEIRKGTNILVGEPIKTITTDDNGNYSISLETGSYTFAISANGYSSSSETVDVIGNKNNQKDLPISPILSEGNVRIVLNWGENPRDLDSHLVKFNSDGSEKYHIYYSSHNVNDGNSPENKTPEGDQLDHDDTDSYGPETITINSLDNSAVYKYYVHDYSNRSNHNDTELKTSGVKVDVYSGDRRKTFYVPNEDGNVWKVFEIVNGEIVPCTNGCVFGVNGSTDSRIGSRDLVDSQENALFRNLPSKKD